MFVKGLSGSSYAACLAINGGQCVFTLGQHARTAPIIVLPCPRRVVDVRLSEAIKLLCCAVRERILSLMVFSRAGAATIRGKESNSSYVCFVTARANPDPLGFHAGLPRGSRDNSINWDAERGTAGKLAR